MTDSKYDRQAALEQRAMTEGIARYRKMKDSKDETDLTPGRVLLKRAMVPLIAAIEADQSSSGKAKFGRPKVYQPYIDSFDAETLAYLVARTVVNRLAVPTPTKLNNLCMKVGTQLQDFQMFEELKPLEPNLFAAMEKVAQGATTERHRVAAIRTAMRVTTEKHSVTGLEWTNEEKLIVGSRLINHLVETTNMVRVQTFTTNNRSTTVVEATPETTEWLTRQHGRCELLHPMYLPMIVPPVSWRQPIGGGYLGATGQPLKMIRTKERDTIDELFSTEMPEVYEAVNHIQKTPWQINRRVLDVIEVLADQGNEVAGLPGIGDEELPPRPAKMAGEPLKEWKSAAAKVHAYNAKQSSKRIALAQQLYVARMMRDEEEIYFPHSLDFRGRVYPVPHGVDPQGNDSAKALLQFSTGKPLGESGAFWLAVHIANLFGVDKVSLEDRVQWVFDNEDKLLDSALDALDGRRFWMDADKPFCALAACFEWAGYKAAGDDFVSHLPVAMDGSCSGLQHYSALLLDRVGGEAVNLVPKDVPADIYTAVADKVEAKLAESSDAIARAWHGKVTRKIVKRPCMTYAYSVTARGMRDQIIEEMGKADGAGGYIPGHTEWAAGNYLAPIVQAAIEETVVAASTAMAWLKVVVKRMNAEQLPIMWETPVGLPVIQREIQYTGAKVQILGFLGKRIKLSYAKSTTKLNTRRQLSGIAPNFIHSLDAAHLMRTVNGCASVGITDFAMVHDSFGCHAADIDALNFIIRAEFVCMYSETDWLEDFKMRCEALLGEELPAVPPSGDLDLTLVESSDFFFA